MSPQKRYEFLNQMAQQAIARQPTQTPGEQIVALALCTNRVHVSKWKAFLLFWIISPYIRLFLLRNYIVVDTNQRLLFTGLSKWTNKRMKYVEIVPFSLARLIEIQRKFIYRIFGAQVAHVATPSKEYWLQYYPKRSVMNLDPILAYIQQPAAVAAAPVGLAAAVTGNNQSVVPTNENHV